VWLDGKAMSRKSILNKKFQLDGMLLNNRINNQQKNRNRA